MDQFILFGDSITQGSFAQQRGFAFGAELVDKYARRLDVINRGHNGYNTAQGLKVLPQVIPPPERQGVRFLTVFFGANDARLPNTPGPSQTISLPQYKANLTSIVTHPLIKAHKDIRVIIITPPPIDERLQEAQDREKYPGIQGLRRTAETTAKYAQAAREVGKENGWPVVDLWTAMMQKAGWDLASTGPLAGSKDLAQNEVLVDFLHDGLHLNPSAYKVLFDEVMALIATTWPDQLPENLPTVLPGWDDQMAWKDL